MFERFTEAARQAIVLAQEEARVALQHSWIGTEHLLLGIQRTGGGAAQELEARGITVDAVRERIRAMVGAEDEQPRGHIPFTPRAKRVLELSLREALKLGHNYIATEHLLLGVLDEPEDVALRLLQDLGADEKALRAPLEQRAAESSEATGGTVTLGDEFREAFATAARAAAAQGRRPDAGDLLLALAEVDDAVRAAITRYVPLEQLRAAVEEGRRGDPPPA